MGVVYLSNCDNFAQCNCNDVDVIKNKIVTKHAGYYTQDLSVKRLSWEPMNTFKTLQTRHYHQMLGMAVKVIDLKTNPWRMSPLRFVSQNELCNLSQGENLAVVVVCRIYA